MQFVCTVLGGNPHYVCGYLGLWPAGFLDDRRQQGVACARHGAPLGLRMIFDGFDGIREGNGVPLSRDSRFSHHDDIPPWSNLAPLSRSSLSDGASIFALPREQRSRPPSRSSTPGGDAMPATSFASGLVRSLRGTALAGAEHALCGSLGGNGRFQASNWLVERAVKGRSSRWFSRRRRPAVLSMQAAIPARLSEISGVRHRLREQLHDWKLDPVMDGAIIATSELVANAVVHGCHGANDVVTMTARCSGNSF